MDIQEYREKIKKKTCSMKEFAIIIDVSYAKALRISHIEGFPLLQIGRDKKVVLSKIDDFIETHIGQIL